MAIYCVSIGTFGVSVTSHFPKLLQYQRARLHSAANTVTSFIISLNRSSFLPKFPIHRLSTNGTSREFYWRNKRED